jgi:hypothetical protein
MKPLMMRFRFSMSEHCIIRADFSNWRPIQGRKVMQLIFEVPIEEAETALKMLGIPQPGESKWCAIALLENGKLASESAAGLRKNAPKPSESTAAPEGQTGQEPSPITATIAETGTSETPSHGRRPFSSLPLSQQAAIRCGDALFQEYLKVETEGDAVLKVRSLCGVESRVFILKGTQAGDYWANVEAHYQSWLTDRKFAGARR